MQIVCENCGAKYIFPDEKIVKNVLRLTCQKCGHVITTRVEEAPSGSAGVLGKWRAAGGVAPVRTKDDSPIWYYSYNGSSNGPFTESELLNKFNSEKLSPVAKHCYVWQKAFVEWKPAIEVEPFASAILMPPPPPAPPVHKSGLDDKLPPLFNDLSSRMTAQSELKQSSPDLAGLKQRLQQSGSYTQKPKYASVSGGSDDDEDEPTQHFEAEPLKSFQSLDAIANTGKIESDTGVRSLKKTIPTSSKLPLVQPITTSGNKSSTNLSAIRSTVTKSATNMAAIKSASLPKLNAFKSTTDTPAIAVPRISSSASLPIVSSDGKKTETKTLSDDLENIDLDIQSDAGDIMGSAVDDLPEIDLTQSGQMESVKRTKPHVSAASLDEEGEQEPQKLLSAADMFAIVGQSKARLNTVESEPSFSSDDIAEIDLDDEESELFTKEDIDQLKDQTSSAGILSNSDDLFADVDNGAGNNVAHVSIPKLDEIQAKHTDLFAELAEAERNQSSDDSVSENSMLIQLEHFNQMQTKSKNRSRTLLIALLLLILFMVAGGIIVSTVFKSEPTVNVRTEQASADNSSGALSGVAGRAISSDELDETLVPQEDFELFLEEPTPTTNKKHRTKTTTSHRSGNAKDQVDRNTESDDDEMEETHVKANQAMDALYGDSQEDSEDAPVKAAAVKKDGRANVVLKRDEFASTDGVQGTKYQINSGGMPTSREQFTIGLKKVSKSVQDCRKREAKNGNMNNIQKVYIQLTVAPSGQVENFKVEEKEVPESFTKCLESKRDIWTFAPFEGDVVKMRQGFVLIN